MVNLGVDVGGTGCKCAAFQENGRQIALSYKEYPMAQGAVSISPALLTECVFDVIRQCAAQVTDEICAITVSSFGESFAALDENGQPLSDITLYFGASENDAFSRLVETAGEERFMQIAKIMPSCAYSLAKMLQFPHAAKFLFVAGFVCFKLSGIAATDESLACRSLLYDVQNGCWSEELLHLAGLSESQLPQVRPMGTILGTLLPEVAQELGLPRTVSVVLGCHDQIAAALGAGISLPGDAVDMCGTCECLTPMFSAIPPAEFTKRNFACVPYSGGYVTYAYNISAGSVVRWFRNTFGQSYEQMNKLCPTTPTDLICLPFLQGMGGTPDTDPSAVGTITGLTTSTTLPELYRGILEGITYELRYNMELLEQFGVSVRQLRAAGGGARSVPWLQIKADILGIPIVPILEEETGAMGSAILGFAAVRHMPAEQIAKDFLRCGEAILPQKHHVEIYNEKYKRYCAIRQQYTERRI
ncbi:MAG: hypothetical protein J6J43_05395 [Oscillospiraceae bacterium]|nr:hypothetical protein [Oscillospiraceae bacterium]